MITHLYGNVINTEASASSMEGNHPPIAITRCKATNRDPVDDRLTGFCHIVVLEGPI
jgi:hypothetical protein